MTERQEQVVAGVTEAAAESPLAGPRGVAAGARHRQHVFPGRGNVVKVLYADEERSAVARAAELTGLRPSGFVAAAAVLFARGLVQSDEGAEQGEPVSAESPVLGGRPVVVSWSAGADQALLEELVRARLALRRYG